MNKPHVHAEVIKAWADGATIQFLGILGVWIDCYDDPRWKPDRKYRVKPERVKYRLGIIKSTGCARVTSCEPQRYVSVERSAYFVRWLGEEQEVEI